MPRRFALVISVLLSLGGCASTTPASPTSPATPAHTSSAMTPAGNWLGSITDAISGSGTMQLTLGEPAQNRSTGTWSATFKNGDKFSGAAVAELLSASGYGIILYVELPPPPCATESGPGGSAPLSFTLINVGVTSNRLTAVASRLSCNGPSALFGGVDLSKQ